MAVTDEIARLVRAARDRTVVATDQQVIALTTAWVEAWDALAPEFDAALAALLADTDGVIPASRVARNRRITQALARARFTLDELAARTQATVTADLATVILDAADAHLASLQAQLPPEAPGVVLGRLDPDALDAIVARTTGRIEAASLALPAEIAALMRAELVRGVTVGDNPRTVARRLMSRTEGAFNGGLARATRIARTEMLDAHRAADLASAQANRSLISARVWGATLDHRTCGSCLAQHGTEWPVDTFGPEDHVQGRCVFFDRTKTWAELGFTGIEDDDQDFAADRDEWWGNLTPGSQDAVLGKTRADLLRDGQITWADLSTRVENPAWRDSHVLTPIRDLPGQG